MKLNMIIPENNKMSTTGKPHKRWSIFLGLFNNSS